MGDKSPKDRDKKKKQHDHKIDEVQRARNEKAQRDKAPPPGQDSTRKVS